MSHLFSLWIYFPEVFWDDRDRLYQEAFFQNPLPVVRFRFQFKKTLLLAETLTTKFEEW